MLKLNILERIGVYNMEFFILLCIELSIMFLGVVALGSFCFLLITLFNYRRYKNEPEDKDK